MKKLKKAEKELIPKVPDMFIYRSGQETIAREYHILRDDVFGFLGFLTPLQASTQTLPTCN